jgi:hypothetical protein
VSMTSRLSYPLAHSQVVRTVRIREPFRRVTGDFGQALLAPGELSLCKRNRFLEDTSLGIDHRGDAETPEELGLGRKQNLCVLRVSAVIVRNALLAEVMK